MCIYLDESGELEFSDKSSKFFVIALLKPKERNDIYRVMKKVRKRKLKKSIKELGVIKAHNSDDFIRTKVLEGIAGTDCEIYCIVFNKKAVFEYLRKEPKKLYNYVAGVVLAESHNHTGKIRIIAHKRETNRMLRDDFNQYLQARLREQNTPVEITHMNAENEFGLQAVDFVSWAIYRKYESSDGRFYDIIKGKIRAEVKLFM